MEGFDKRYCLADLLLGLAISMGMLGIGIGYPGESDKY